MPKERNALKAGIFIVLCIAAALAIVYAVKGTSFEATQLRQVSFALKDNLSGLRVGDEVRIGGYKVGEVRGIEIVAADDKRLAKRLKKTDDQAALLVTFTLPQKYQVRNDTRISIETTVTEKTCLNISRLGTGDIIAADVTLVGNPSSLYAAMDSLSESLPRVNRILALVEEKTIPGINDAVADVRAHTLPGALDAIKGFRAAADAATALIKHVHEKVNPIVGKYTEVVDSARQAMDNAASLMGDRTSDTDLRGTIKNLRSITESVNKKMPSLLDDVHKGVIRVNETIETAKKTIDNILEITESAKSVIAGNEARFHSMVRHLNQTSINMQNFSQDIYSRPWRLLYTPKRNELQSLAIFQTARDFAQGASDLNEATQALKDAASDKRAAPEQVKKLVEQVQERFKRFQEVETKLWSSIKE